MSNKTISIPKRLLPMLRELVGAVDLLPIEKQEQPIRFGDTVIVISGFYLGMRGRVVGQYDAVGTYYIELEDTYKGNASVLKSEIEVVERRAI